MRKIYKAHEPASLAKYKRCNPNHQYKDLTDTSVRQDIRQACTIEQYFLCAYCCKEISGTNVDTMNEHIQPRHHFPSLSMDFNNIVASCTTTGQCDDSKGSQILDLTPFMSECETELEFRLNGRVKGQTQRAQEVIETLQLNNQKLCESRKQAIDNILFSQGLDNPITIEDEELLLSIIDDIKQPDEYGKMQGFSPIVANVISNWISKFSTSPESNAL